MPRRGKSAELARWLEERHPARIGEAEFAQLFTALAPVSDSYLRKLVRGCGVPLDPIEGFFHAMGVPIAEAQNKLVVTRATIPVAPQVVILTPRG